MYLRPLHPLYMRWGVTKLQVADLAGAQELYFGAAPVLVSRRVSTNSLSRNAFKVRNEASVIQFSDVMFIQCPG
ncbi:hypothetical protein J6590_105323, partial [Homalodisca vitripennis]